MQKNRHNSGGGFFNRIGFNTRLKLKSRGLAKLQCDLFFASCSRFVVYPNHASIAGKSCSLAGAIRLRNRQFHADQLAVTQRRPLHFQQNTARADIDGVSAEQTTIYRADFLAINRKLNLPSACTPSFTIHPIVLLWKMA